MEPMIETGNGGYAYMDELAKYRIYGLHDMFNYQSATFICHDGERWRCVVHVRGPSCFDARTNGVERRT